VSTRTPPGEARRFAGSSALDDAEVRVLGCLLEKQRTTPDAYPLSLNALRLAANQSTNRDPVVDYDDATIRAALHRLERRGLARLASGAGSRAVKFRHLLADALPMEDAEQALLCVLMLRGAQTPGELKQRAERLHPFADLASVHATLEGLNERGLAAPLERRPGHKEERYVHLLGEPAGDAARTPAASAHDDDGSPDGPAPDARPTAAEELTELGERVARLEREVAELREVAHPRAGRADDADRAEAVSSEPARWE
jgi:uncharacterized protein YceH (UPF0502 family)